MSRHCSSVKSVGYDLSFIAPLPRNLTPTRRVNNSPDQMSRDNNCLKFSKPCNGHTLKRPRFLVGICSFLAVLGIALVGTTLFQQYQVSGNGRTISEQIPTLMVLPFENDSSDPAQNIFAKGITEEVIGALILFKNILVLGADTSFQFRTETALRNAAPSAHIDYVLKGSIDRMESQIQVNVALLRALDHQYLWSGSFRKELTSRNMLDLRRDIATQVALILVQPHGVIDKAELRNTVGRPSESLTSYECILRAREY